MLLEGVAAVEIIILLQVCGKKKKSFHAYAALLKSGDTASVISYRYIFFSVMIMYYYTLSILYFKPDMMASIFNYYQLLSANFMQTSYTNCKTVMT